MKIHNHFPIAILEHQVDVELADKVEQQLLEHIEALPYRDSFVGNVATDFFSDARIDIFTMFPDLIDEFVSARNAYQEVTTFQSSDKLTFWTQDYRDETGIHVKHQHGVNGISGVYWIRANEQAGALTFHNPNTVLDYVSADEIDNPYRSMHSSYQPVKGKLLLFPSYLQHEVQPSQEGVVRTTIAFNFLHEERLK